MRCDIISAQAGPLSQYSYKIKNLGMRDLASLKWDSHKPGWPASHMNANSKMYENDVRDRDLASCLVNWRVRLIRTGPKYDTHFQKLLVVIKFVRSRQPGQVSGVQMNCVVPRFLFQCIFCF